jgi:hypothetical protein
LKVTFFFPYYLISGVPVLFSNLAKDISNNYEVEVTIIDYEDGYMSRILEHETKIKKIFFYDGKSISIDTDVLVLQSILPFQLRPEVKISNKTKLLFWNLHPSNLILNTFPWKLFINIRSNLYKQLVVFFSLKKYNQVKSFIINSRDKNGLVFMDSSNYNNTIDFYNLELHKPVSYLPIACSNGNYRKLPIASSKTTLNISWIGRICDFKINSLNLLIRHLAHVSLKLKQKLILYVIGSGNEEKNLKYDNHLNRYFKVIIIGSLSKLKLDEFLYSNIDINASMGTSVLESAKFGIPSIVLDFDLNNINDNYTFRWLHETLNYDLGHFITNADYGANNSMEKMITHFNNEGEVISKKVYNYYLENHSLKSVSDNLVISIMKTEFLYSNINSSILKKGLVRRLYEIIKYGKIN